jgi:hypothetical protein
MPRNAGELLVDEPPRVHLAGILGITFAGLGLVADLLMQFTPDSALLGPAHIDTLLGRVALWRIWAGAYVGVIAFVLAGAGIWQAHRGLAPSPRQARVFLVSGLLGYAWGAAFHFSFLFRGLLDHAATIDRPLLDAFQTGQIGVAAASAAMIVTASACYVWLVARGRTSYPRWAAVLNPAVLYALLSGAAYSIPVVGLLLAPAAFSLMSLVFFTSCVMLLKHRSPAKPSTRSSGDGALMARQDGGG